jgi:hypothetical protein
VLSNLATRFEDANLVLENTSAIAEDLRAFGQEIGRLPILMRECGVDEAIINQRRAAIESIALALERVTPP